MIYDQSLGVLGLARHESNIPSQMEEPARSNQFAPVSGLQASGISGPTESAMLQKLWQFRQVNPWATKFMANPRLWAVRPPGHYGTEDTPPNEPMIGE